VTANIEHRFRKLDVSKMAWTGLVIAAAGETREGGPICPKSPVDNSFGFWYSRLVRFLVLDFCDGHATYFFWAEDAKLYIIHFLPRGRGVSK
jgi:hypothetical protein